MNRRKLILGGVALIAAPAIVRAEWLMPVKVIEWEWEWFKQEEKRYIEKHFFNKPFLPTHWWGKFEPLEAQIGDLWDHVGGGGITTYRCHRVIDCLTEPVKDGRMWSQRLWVSSDGKEEQKGWAWIDAA